MLSITTAFAFTATTTTPTFLSSSSSSSSSSSNYNKGGELSAERNEDQDEGGGALGKKSYNDGALYNFHMMTQAQKIRDYSAMDTYIDTNSLWNLDWHDAFVRNGLSDFVPPLTDTLNVLVVEGSGAAAPRPEEGFQGTPNNAIGVVGDGSTITNTKATAPVAAAAAGEAESAESTPAQKLGDSSCSFLAAVFEKDDNNGSGGALDVASYDCIMDRGLMGDLCAARDNREEMGRLLREATKRIRENGVYIANTPPLSSETKDYLTEVGTALGLQWEFDLDGISDSNLSVSVARKYWNGELPSLQSERPLPEE